MMFTTAIASVAMGATAAPPVVIVDRDNVEISESCIVEIHREFIEDVDGNGVIHIVADDITVEFTDNAEHRELMQVPDGTPWNELNGIGIRIDGRSNVTLKNAHVHRFRIGIHATNADGLTLDGCDVSGGYMMRLKSTPAAEDGSDWLWPHANENNEWARNYGAGIFIEESSNITVKNCFARQRQNGIMLDTVTDSKVYDNDCSFLSGWGLAMWKSSRNVISRNAFDFCVRGYSHGVYNRGQDSAGILFFEQNHDNVIAENSATHGGDGFFAFAGREAMGEHWLNTERERLKRETGRENVDDLIVIPAEVLERVKRNGNTGNLLINNDFSYAPAHGIEMTFSFDNAFIGNRLVENAICGVWGGYSQDTLIAGNEFIRNGDMAYGLERGGINIEHGIGNRILDNTFIENKAGVHLWWDADDGLMNLPWSKANHPDFPTNEDGSVKLTARVERMLPSARNLIANNTFEGDTVALHLREANSTNFVNNVIEGIERPIDSTNSEMFSDPEVDLSWEKPAYPVYGETRPVGARKELRGRDKIIITEWGPYDWTGPYVQRLADPVQGHEWRLLGNARLLETSAYGGVTTIVEERDGRPLIRILPKLFGAVSPYTLTVRTTEGTITREAVVVNTRWTVRVFDWQVDPRENAEQWRLDGEAAALTFNVPTLHLPYGSGGPSDLASAPDEVKAARLPADRFGTIAETIINLPPGEWRIKTTSDDGIRVWVDDELVVDDWTWHAPKRNDGTFSLKTGGRVRLRVEHFELDGWSTLEVDLEPVK